MNTMIPLAPRTRLFLQLTLAGYFGLWLLIPAWYLYLSPPEAFPGVMAVVILLFPLVFPFKGLLSGKPYTFAWSGFLALIYFLHAAGELAAGGDDQRLAALEMLFSIAFYAGAMLFARLRGKELKAAEEES